ncbi:hypothetical protein C8F01DRAFT_1156201 [Mycena amicta]|nr:hypothetical protein C8F01DRAFT_1156201 [Mycena amicta]
MPVSLGCRRFLCGVVLVAHACFGVLLCVSFLIPITGHSILYRRSSPYPRRSIHEAPSSPPPTADAVPTLNAEQVYDIPTSQYTLSVFAVLHSESAKRYPDRLRCRGCHQEQRDISFRELSLDFGGRRRWVGGDDGGGAGPSNGETGGIGGGRYPWADLVFWFSPTSDNTSFISIVVGSLRPSRAQSARARCPTFVQPHSGVQAYASRPYTTFLPSSGRMCFGGEGFKGGFGVYCRRSRRRLRDEEGADILYRNPMRP